MIRRILRMMRRRDPRVMARLRWYCHRDTLPYYGDSGFTDDGFR